MEKEHIIKAFLKWKVGQEKLSGNTVSPRDFDSWISGYVTGITSATDFNVEDIKSVVDEVVKSDEIKAIGITGTSAEHFDIEDY